MIDKMYDPRKQPKVAKGMVCKTCETIGKPVMVTKGNLIIEIILWLSCMLFLPLGIAALGYSIWRQTTKYKACRSCGSINIISKTSPAGIKILKPNQATTSTETSA